MPPSPSFHDLLQLLGLSVRDPLVAAISSLCIQSPDEDLGWLYLEAPTCGFSVLLKREYVTTIFLYSEGREGYSEYPHRMEGNIRLGDDRRAIRRALGSPTLGHSTFDRFDRPTYALHVEFDSAGVSTLVTLMHPENAPSLERTGAG